LVYAASRDFSPANLSVPLPPPPFLSFWSRPMQRWFLLCFSFSYDAQSTDPFFPLFIFRRLDPLAHYGPDFGLSPVLPERPARYCFLPLPCVLKGTVGGLPDWIFFFFRFCYEETRDFSPLLFPIYWVLPIAVGTRRVGMFFSGSLLTSCFFFLRISIIFIKTSFLSPSNRVVRIWASHPSPFFWENLS